MPDRSERFSVCKIHIQFKIPCPHAALFNQNQWSESGSIPQGGKRFIDRRLNFQGGCVTLTKFKNKNRLHGRLGGIINRRRRQICVHPGRDKMSRGEVMGWEYIPQPQKVTSVSKLTLLNRWALYCRMTSTQTVHNVVNTEPSQNYWSIWPNNTV